jgi:acetyl esterase/lipase
VVDTYPPPPFDAELLPVLRRINETIPPTLDLDRLIGNRTAARPPSVVEQRLAAGTLVCEDHAAPGLDGDPAVTLSVFGQPTGDRGGPAIYFIHGGGMVSGDRRSIDAVLPLIDLLQAVVVSVYYRLAPEHPDPAPVNDCYAGLVWTAAHADDVGFDPSRLVIAGVSAGGGLAAGSALLARDQGGPHLAAQILMCPMIDDRNRTVSSRQIEGIGIWDRTSNGTGWSALLGDRRGTDRVSVYAAPARSTDLSALPPAYIDCGSAEVFRDEAVAYASALWAAGGVADLHVWAGGFHSFDTLAPGASLSAAARQARVQFLRRTLGLTEVRSETMAPGQGRFGI